MRILIPTCDDILVPRAQTAVMAIEQVHNNLVDDRDAAHARPFRKRLHLFPDRRQQFVLHPLVSDETVHLVSDDSVFFLLYMC